MTIRAATFDDIPVLIELLKTLFAIEADFHFDAAKSQCGLELMLQSPEVRTILIAQIEGEVAGMCSAQIIISTAMGAPAIWIEDVILKPQFRGRGLMPLLLTELERWASERGVQRFQVLCDTQNQPAMAFYPKVGFKQTQLGCFFKYPM